MTKEQQKRTGVRMPIDRSTQMNIQRNISRNPQQQTQGKTQQKQTDGHRCERCNRKLKDQSARLGWRCAEILGATKGLNRAGDGAFNDFRIGIENAGRCLKKNKVDTSRMNLPKFYESHVKHRLAAGMDNEHLWTLAWNDMREALNPTYDRYGNIILQQSEAPDIDTMFDLRDQVDYERGKYSTTGLTDNKFNSHALALQEALNAYGAVDKFGNSLKEDGIFGPKTQWAVDILGGVEAYGATSDMETDKAIGEVSNVSKNARRNYNQKETSPHEGFGGGFDGESRTMRDEYWNAKEMPYVSRILNGYPREENSALGTLSDYNEIINNAGTAMEEGSPLSKKEKALYSEALEEAVSGLGLKKTGNSVYIDLTEEQKMFVAILFAEMGSERIVDSYGNITNQPNTEAWKAVANIIMNRLNNTMDSWKNAENITDIITDPGAFSGYNDNNYKFAMQYLNNRNFENDTMEALISTILPIYLKEDTNDTTNGAILYYSPESMSLKNSTPPWNFDILEEIEIEGVPKTSLRVFNYNNR